MKHTNFNMPTLRRITLIALLLLGTMPMWAEDPCSFVKGKTVYLQLQHWGSEDGWEYSNGSAGVIFYYANGQAWGTGGGKYPIGVNKDGSTGSIDVGDNVWNTPITKYTRLLYSVTIPDDNITEIQFGRRGAWPWYWSFITSLKAEDAGNNNCVYADKFNGTNSAHWTKYNGGENVTNCVDPCANCGTLGLEQ